MAKILVQGVPREIMLRDDEARQAEEWPWSESPICCPNCTTIFHIDPNDDKRMDVLLSSTGGYVETVDASVRCPNCCPPKRLGWNIHLRRRRGGPFWNRRWITTITHNP